jgi:hypothetical protein
MIKYLHNHSSIGKSIGIPVLIEELESKIIFGINFSKNISDKFIEDSIKFYKNEGMFISYDQGSRTLKYKIGSHD